MGKISGKNLADKYNNFLNPVTEVIVSGREINTCEGLYMQNMQVISSVGRDPDMAVLVYHADKYPKEPHECLERYLDVGQKIEIKAGYEKETTRIFLGYLHEVETADYMQTYIEYTLICLDVKGLMKKNSIFQFSASKNIQQILNEIMGTGCYSSFIEKKKIDTLPKELNQDCVIKGETHYDWLCSLAQYLDYEFFCGRGEMKFRKAEESDSELVNLTEECNIEAVRSAITMTEQTGSVQICGYNRKDQKILETALWPGISRPFGGKMKQSLSGCMMALWDMELETGEQAKQRAGAVMKHLARKSTRVEITMSGIPELIPGICADITNEDTASLSGKMYVQEVRHLLDENGFRTMAKGVWKQV